ncbi:putative signal peptide protein [Puccinia sorghi]|uniref:Putative signal peptide protein n=1 Tax=Puccinia sorghi TaxID=27349 RepID=A0A0L6UVP0_9BASI|nr:putative signal peptide protein [Puccinia sorghi]
MATKFQFSFSLFSLSHSFFSPSSSSSHSILATKSVLDKLSLSPALKKPTIFSRSCNLTSVTKSSELMQIKFCVNNSTGVEAVSILTVHTISLPPLAQNTAIFNWCTRENQNKPDQYIENPKRIEQVISFTMSISLIDDIVDEGDINSPTISQNQPNGHQLIPLIICPSFQPNINAPINQITSPANQVPPLWSYLTAANTVPNMSGVMRNSINHSQTRRYSPLTPRTVCGLQLAQSSPIRTLDKGFPGTQLNPPSRLKQLLIGGQGEQQPIGSQRDGSTPLEDTTPMMGPLGEFKDYSEVMNDPNIAPPEANHDQTSPPIITDPNTGVRSH